MEGLEPRAWNPARRCVGTNRSGERCWRQPIAGGDVCVVHGGAAPQVRASAEKRLLALREPVLDAFEEIFESWRGTRCATCGRPTGDPAPVIRLGQIILDRTGHHPSLRVETTERPNPFKDLDDDQLIEKLETLLEAARARRDLHRQHTLAVIDGEVDPGFTLDPATEPQDPETLQMGSPEPEQPSEDQGVTASDDRSGNSVQMGTDQVPLGIDTTEKGTDE